MAGNAGLNSKAGLYALIALLLAVIGGGAYYAGLVPNMSDRLPETVRSTDTTAGPDAAETPKPAAAPVESDVQPDKPAPQGDADQPAETAEAVEQPAETAQAVEPATETAEAEDRPAETVEVDEPPAVAQDDTARTTQPSPDTQEATQQPPALPAPDFDVVRVDPDGSAIVAGTAAPGAVVSFLLDDQVVGTAVAGSDGKFAGFISVEVGTQARVLTMLSELGDQVASSDDQIILAPVAPASTDVASADIPDETQPSGQGSETAQPAETSDETVAALDQDATVPVVPQSDPVGAGDADQVEETQSASDQAAPVNTQAEPATTAEAQVGKPAQTDSAGPVAATQPSSDPVGTAETAQTAEIQPAPEQSSEPAPRTGTESATESAPETVAAAPDVAEPAPEVQPETVAAAPDVAEPAQDAKPETVAVQDSQPQVAQLPAPADVTTSPPQVGETPKADDVPGATVPAVDAPPDPAPAAVAVLRAGKDGVELLQPDTPQRPEAMVSIALDTIGYSETGDVLLSGRSRGQSVVRVYVNNSAVTDLNADDAGKWKGQIAGIDPGVYTLRLDELGEAGQVLSRLETPFKREAPEVLNPPRPETASVQAPPVRAVTVQKGDTLWAISRERYGDGLLYVRVFDANRDHIRNPDLIYPGQVFAIPE